MEIYFPLLICLIGWLLWVLVDPTKYPKIVETGKVMFWTGLLAFLLLGFPGARVSLRSDGNPNPLCPPGHVCKPLGGLKADGNPIPLCGPPPGHICKPLGGGFKG